MWDFSWLSSKNRSWHRRTVTEIAEQLNHSCGFSKSRGRCCIFRAASASYGCIRRWHCLWEQMESSNIQKNELHPYAATLHRIVHRWLKHRKFNSCWTELMAQRQAEISSTQKDPQRSCWVGQLGDIHPIMLWKTDLHTVKLQQGTLERTSCWR